MNNSVYLDTTIPSYLFDERESIKLHIEATQKWWAQESSNFDIWISDYFSIALSYEYTDFLANYFKTLYNEESGVFLNYQTLKIGIIF